MSNKDQSESAWVKLARLAATAPREEMEMPFGFPTRVIAQWRDRPREAMLSMFEWFTVRGLAVAVLILAGSAAFGYDAIAGVINGDTSVTGGLMENIFNL